MSLNLHFVVSSTDLYTHTYICGNPHAHGNDIISNPVTKD